MNVFYVVQAELFKAFRKKRIYIFAAMLWLIVPVIMLATAYFTNQNLSTDFVNDTVGSDDAVLEVIKSMASAEMISRVTLVLSTHFASFLTLVIAALAALLVGEERSQKMWKTTLIAQPHRVSVMLGKVITAMLILLFLFAGALAVNVLLAAIGTAFLPSDLSGNWLEVIKFYGIQWAYCLPIVLFSFLMMRLIRNNVLAVIGVLFLPTIVQSLYGIYTLLTNIGPIQNRIVGTLEMLKLRRLVDSIPQYFLTTNFTFPSKQVIFSMPPSEFTEGIQEITNGPFASMFQLELSQSAWVMAAYALIFGALLFFEFSRRDIQ